MTVKRGQDALIRCDTDTVLMWTFNDGNLPSNVVISNNSVIIVNAIEENSGTYECLIQMPRGVVHAQSVITVAGKASSSSRTKIVMCLW